MTEQEFVTKATDLTKQIVDILADKEYAKLASLAQIDSSWVEEGQTQEEAFVSFGEWLDGQLAMWEEDEERSFVVDHFDESCLEEIVLEEDNTSFATYNPTNAGEELDFWFELKYRIENDEHIIVILNVNI